MNLVQGVAASGIRNEVHLDSLGDLGVELADLLLGGGRRDVQLAKEGGDDFVKGLPGWCSTKKAGSIFFWLAFGRSAQTYRVAVLDYFSQCSGWLASSWSFWISATARPLVPAIPLSLTLKIQPIWMMKSLCLSIPRAASRHTMLLLRTLLSMIATVTLLRNPQRHSALPRNYPGPALTRMARSRTLLPLASQPAQPTKILESAVPCNTLTHMLPSGVP